MMKIKKDKSAKSGTMDMKKKDGKAEESDEEKDKDPYAYTSGDSEPEREIVFRGLGDLERKMWIE